MNAWIECSLPDAHCQLPIAHCSLPMIARCAWTKKPLQRRIAVRSVSGGPGLFSEGGEDFLCFVFVIQGGEDFVFCVWISFSRRWGFFCILYFVFVVLIGGRWVFFSYFVFLIQGGEDFLYFVFVFLFQGCEDLFVFWKCICYPRVAGESISEFCTIIKFQLV